MLARAGILCACVVLLSACAVALSELYQKPQYVLINPELAVEPTPIGQGRTLVLDVVDRRPKNILGYRGGVDPTTAPIYPKSSVAEVVRASLSAVIREYDFVVREGEPASSIRIRVELERLVYATNHEVWPTSLSTTGAVKVICRNGPEYYSSRYTAEYREGVKWPPGDKAIAKSVNEALSRVLNRLLTDPALLRLLARKEYKRDPSPPIGGESGP